MPLNPFEKTNMENFNKDKPLWSHTTTYTGAWVLSGLQYGSQAWDLIGVFLSEEEMCKAAGSLSVLEYEAVQGQLMEFNKPFYVLKAIAFKRSKTWIK